MFYNNIKRNVMAVICLVTLVMSVGCGNNTTDIQKGDVADVVGQTGVLTHSGDNIVIDAEPDISGSEYGVYSFLNISFDDSHIFDILFHDKDSATKETFSWEENGKTVYSHSYKTVHLQDDTRGENVQAEFGESLLVGGEPSGIMYTTPLSHLVLSFFRPADMSYTAISGNDFTTDSLSFSSPDDAIHEVTNVLETIGLKVSDSPEIFAIDAPTANVVMERHRNMNIYGFNTALYPDSYSISDECYFIVFNATHNEVPIYNNGFNFTTVPDLYIGHPEIHVIYSQRGIEYLNVTLGIDEYELIETVTEIVNAESAMNIVVSRYNELITSSNIVFKSVTLMYVFKPAGNGSQNLIMTPAWVFDGVISSPSETFDGRGGVVVEMSVAGREVIIIDALTGVEII